MPIQCAHPSFHSGKVSTMEACIFDIDGTLLESFEADCELFIKAVRTVLGVSEVDRDWSAYTHVTDQGVLRELMEANDIPPDEQLIEATKREFLTLLRAHIDTAGPFREIPGARGFVSRLMSSQQHYVAYATGAWRESALLKLNSAGFPTDGIRVSTSSEFEDRVSIMRSAVAGAPPNIGKITYYGDGVWDQVAAGELGWEFVPVGTALGGIVSYFNEQ